jgi:hypothetical protein
VRPLTLDEQIETLIVHFEGLIDQVKKEVDLGNMNRMKSMEVDLNKVRTDCKTQISDSKSTVEVRVAEIQKKTMEKVAEMCGFKGFNVMRC